MICPLCSKDTKNTVVCEFCGKYMHSKRHLIYEMFAEKKRTGVFYLTVGTAGQPQKTITAEHSATVKIDQNHRYLEISTQVGDVSSSVTKAQVDDSCISRSDSLVLAEDSGEIKITQIPPEYCLNGEEVGANRPSLSPGDVINLSNYTYIKFDLDLERPAACSGMLSLVPDTYRESEYVITYDGKRFFDGIRNELTGSMNLDVIHTTSDVCKKKINKWILGRDLRPFTEGRI